MRPCFPNAEVTLFDTEDLTPRPMDVAVLVELAFIGAQGSEAVLVQVLESPEDESSWAGTVACAPKFLPMEPGDLVNFGHRNILAVYDSDIRCRTWTGATDKEGHGLLELDDGEIVLAGEWALLNTEGGQEKIPGWVVYWNCANPACVRPSHLEQVPPEEVGLRDAATEVRRLQATEEVVLIDGEFMHDISDKFWMPHLDDRENLPVGESVKLIFTDGDTSERMWVRVTAKKEDKSYIGSLRNLPVHLSLIPGQSIHFEPKNVIEIGCEADCHVE